MIMPQDWLILFFLMALGGCVGSFMNVVIYRWPLGRSVVHPGSSCPKCGKKIRGYHNIPVLGWLMLRGRCFDCGAPISGRYAVIELGVAGLFFLLAYNAFYYRPENLESVARQPIIQGAIYVCQLILACSLLCTVMIKRDGYRPPFVLYALAGLSGLATVAMMWHQAS